MSKLIDFKCQYAEFTGVDKEFVESLNLALPDVYFDADSIAKYASNQKLKENSLIAMVTFDPVLEAESLGANIKFDASNLGPRKDSDVANSIDELLNLPKMDLTKGRMGETLKAISILKAEGETVAIEVNGPMVILNALTDINNVLIGWRKKPDKIEAILYKIKEDLLRYCIAAQKAGCDIIYYSDGAGSLNIIGPKYLKKIVDIFLVPFLKDLDANLERKCLVHLCPKSSFALVGLNAASWNRYQLSSKKNYEQSLLEVSGKVRFLGQKCRKNYSNTEINSISFLNLI